MYLGKKVSIIVSVADNGVLSSKGNLPWNEIPEDIERTRQLILDQSVIMGRKTLEAIGRPIPRSQNIILTKKGAGAIEGVDLGDQVIYISNSLRAAVGLAEHDVFVLGGQKAYKEALEIADVIYMTQVHQYCAGDRFFKFSTKVNEEHLNEEGWKLVEAKMNEGFSFLTFVRK